MMTDPLENIRNYLLTQTSITDLVADRIYAATDADNLPPLYKPSTGAAIAFKIRGGDLNYSSTILRPSVQFESFGIDEVTAHTVDRKLHDVLHDKKTQYFKMALREVLGTLLYTPPPTLWPYVLSFFEFQISNDVES